jgi:hypothetical protein
MIYSALAAVVGILVTIGLGCLVKPAMDKASTELPLDPPNDQLREAWKQLTGGNEGGKMIGCLERALFFIAFWLSDGLATGGIVAGWLAFKLGSKWQAWSCTIVMPETLANVDPLAYRIALRQWGSHALTTFLVGTLGNLLAGAIGGVIARYGAMVIQAASSCASHVRPWA